MHRSKNYLTFCCNSPCPFFLTIHICKICISELIYIINWFRWIFNYIIRSVDNSWRGDAPCDHWFAKYVFLQQLRICQSSLFIAVYWLVFVKLFENFAREYFTVYSNKISDMFHRKKRVDCLKTQKSSDDIQKQLPSMLCVLQYNA